MHLNVQIKILLVGRYMEKKNVYTSKSTYLGTFKYFKLMIKKLFSWKCIFWVKYLCSL